MGDHVKRREFSQGTPHYDQRATAGVLMCVAAQEVMMGVAS